MLKNLNILKIYVSGIWIKGEAALPAEWERKLIADVYHEVVRNFLKEYSMSNIR